MARRLSAILTATLAFLALGAASALACGGLIASLEKGHAEVLRRATTLAGWHDGKEHYVTGFQFAGNADSFGYLIPLPGNPSKIEKGGDWTLERLLREVTPQVEVFALAAPAGRAAADQVEVLQQVKIDSLDIKIIRGGGVDIVEWAKQNGFGLDHDADSMFLHYAKTKAIFAAAKFDTLLAKKQNLAEGQGVAIHFTIPLSAPWIPLKILSLGKGPVEPVRADLFILTDDKPVLTPAPGSLAGMDVIHNAPASDQLLTDLRGDKGMDWVPTTGYLTALKLDAAAGTMTYDLSIDGGVPIGAPIPLPSPSSNTWLLWAAMAAGMGAVVALLRSLRMQPGATA